MILTARHAFDVDGGQVSLLAHRDWRCWLLEREWKHNLPNVSCVPRGLYDLSPHSSSKYPNTFALVGATVAHYPDGHRPRSVCVIHSAIFPTDLEGCVAAANAISPHGHTIESEDATTRLLDIFSASSKPQLLLL